MNSNYLNSVSDLYSNNYLYNVIGSNSSNSNSSVFNLILYSLLNASNNANIYNNINSNHCCCCNSNNSNNIVENTISSNNVSVDTLFETISTPSKNYKYNIDGDTTIKINSGNKEWDSRIEIAIKKSSEKYGIDEDLIKTIIKIESNFNPNVTSKSGAKGLMQLMPINIKAYNVSDPYNIEENIDAGTKHIKEYLDRYNGDLDMALIAYNYGPGNMKRRGITSLDDLYKAPKETQNYIAKVNKYYIRKTSGLQTV